MCGIVGIVDFNRPELDIEALKTMTESLFHRGPDAFGMEYWFNNNIGVALAHRRLSIIDLSSNGRQPMCNEDGQIWIVFNGEIYNFRELRQDLEQKGHTFKSYTDSEVIVHLYVEEGEDCVKRFNGMFAFAIWDRRKERLLLARDRAGVKPLVYTLSDGRCLFASEIKSLIRYPGVEQDLDFEALELYFTFNFIPAPWTIFTGIRKLPPASYLIMDRKGHHLVNYWDISHVAESSIDSIGEASERLHSLVENATRIRMYSDVPLGAFLSGGIDSSIVVANMARSSSQQIQTYFIGYSNDPLFDESPYASAVADMYDTDHHEIRLSPQDFYDVVENVVSFFDEPFADSSALPTYVVSRETRRHVTVALSGDGGDELFGGYRRYLAILYNDMYMRIPRPLREGLLNPLFRSLPDSKGHRLLEIFRRLKIFINGVGPSSSFSHYKWLTYFPDQDREELFQPEIRSQFSGLGMNCIKKLMPTAWDDVINQSLFVDYRFLLPFDMLTKVDWMSMVHSLEVRSPFLDYRIAELAFQMPGSYKVKRGNLKYILKKTFKDLLPSTIWNRPKQGFEIPVGEWFKYDEGFKKRFWEIVDLSKLEQEGIFKQNYIKHLYDSHLAGRRDNSHKLWAIFVFESWRHGQYKPISINT